MSLERLSANTLAKLRDCVARPGYDRHAVRAGIVHLGVGGFHRAHQAMYIDALMNQGLALDWGICGVGTLPADRAMRDVMHAQDCLYTLVVRHSDGRLEPRVVGSIVEYLYAPDDPEAVVAKLVDRGTRIVSLTITEGGYNVHHVTGEFDVGNPLVQADLRPGAEPTSVFGMVVEALRRRRALGYPPFTVVSCDNIQHNGDIARRALTAYASLRDPELAEWIERDVAFPSSMVDRITPTTNDDDRKLAVSETDLVDAWPVVCESYCQWVLEDRFVDGRPPLEAAGVQMVDSVAPYEMMKLYLLNAGHQALGYLGYLAGYRLVHEACQEPNLCDFLVRYMDDEATPTLDPVPGIDLPAYKASLVERFSNPYVGDTLARLCAESSDRIPKFVLPVVRHQLASGGGVTRAAAIVAAWARYAEGIDEDGNAIDVVDQLREPLMAAAARQRVEPTAFIEQRAVFGDLADDDRFRAAYLGALWILHERGARALLETLASQRS